MLCKLCCVAACFCCVVLISLCCSLYLLYYDMFPFCCDLLLLCCANFVVLQLVSVVFTFTFNHFADKETKRGVTWALLSSLKTSRAAAF